jgi:hypothetical protein
MAMAGGPFTATAGITTVGVFSSGTTNPRLCAAGFRVTGMASVGPSTRVESVRHRRY